MLEFLKGLFHRWTAAPSTSNESLQTAVAGQCWAEVGLWQSEKRFRLLVASVQDYAIFMLDPEGRVVTWNAGAQRIKGYKAEEIIGQHFSRFYPPESVERGWPAEELRRAAAEGRIEDEGWRVRKDGSKFRANVVITALRDEGGVLRGFAKVTRDMTERRQAEASARRLLQEEAARQAAEASAQEARRAQQEERRQREQLHVTLTSIGDAVIVTDKNGIVTFMNPVAVGLTGWEPQEAAGQPLERIFRIINEETRQPIEDPVRKVLHEGTVIGLANHTVLIARDGREIPIDDSGAPIRGEGGTIAGVVLVFRDVTEARRAVEDRLHLAAIVESSDDAIISNDLNGIITSWNRGAERLYGYTAQEIVGKPLPLLVPPDHPNEVPALLERIKRGERIEHFETVRLRKDGSRIARDISARKRIEAELRQADRLKDEFLATLAHELRNPLAPIRNALYVMKQQGVDGGVIGQMRDMAERQVQHMARLLDDLLDMSRISRGRIELRTEPVEVATVVRRAVESVHSLIEERRHELTVSLPAEPLRVMADPARLEQVRASITTLSNPSSRKPWTPCWPA
jgi:PAS domain S-box-containing protein